MPIIHGLWLYGLSEQSTRIGLTWIGTTALFNGVGVIAYALKFPEAYCPRRFDLLGASHQIMHVMVVIAALSYAKAMIVAFDQTHRQDTIVYQQMSNLRRM
ncbi:hypothetical protein PFICI_09613 [Pestalotiopsis fici W106-1]|uniref:Uncharacterized protein n=1 Tax=Pestalotiopsis fici (strain W106-1 / CGMCC3.15140) TaxID=1229662 RepID=W3X119_PESFW|nr:uncharacterized protein PFICI_09613 [Pestalotiopsis fici W106-1]ETS79760.1 hypothetical protein PFICI_09613 [Pestalotiopsis fici W106-1]